MTTSPIRSILAASLTVAAITLVACGGGDTGSTGPQGPAGPAGPSGSSGPVVRVHGNAAPATDAQAAAWAALKPKVTVTGVTIASAPVVSFTVADANGAPVVGLGNTSKSATATLPGLTNLAFSMAKLVPASNGSPSQWVSYIVTTVPLDNQPATPTPSCPNKAVCLQRPGTDNTGTLVDNGDGTYKYTFHRDITSLETTVDGITPPGNSNKADLGDLTYEPNLVHRLTIQLSGNAPGTGANTPNGVAFSTVPGVPLTNAQDAIHDFVPATGPVTDSGRDIVATAKCAECHRVLGGIPGDNPESSGAGFHGGARNETRYCVVCHTEQRKYGRTEVATTVVADPTDPTKGTIQFPANSSTNVVDGRAIGNLPNHIHKTHMGKLLAKKNYNYGGVLYNEVLFPQDLRNCTKCHDGAATSTAPTKQGDNWKNVPSRMACGGCHDGINFATGMGVTIADAAKGRTATTSFGGFAHGGQSQADDSLCATCHTPGNIDIVHLPITPPNTRSALHVQGGSANSNSASIASNTSRLPSGAIKVTYDIKSVTRDATTKRPVMVFRMLQNGLRKDLNNYDTTAPNPVTGRREIWDGFMGAPSVYFVYAVPQEAAPFTTTAPADFNASVAAYLRCLWNGTTTAPDPNSCVSGGTLTGPDTDGYYTATLTAQIPDTAVMLTGGIGYSYSLINTLPLTQTNLADYPATRSTVPVTPVTVPPTPANPGELTAGMPNSIGGLIVVAPNAQKVASAGCPVAAGPAACVTSGTVAGSYLPRRPIVEDKRCNACHQELGTFTEEAFHGGQRNDGTTCSWCHTPNRTSSAWSADSTSFVHAIHAGKKRAVKFNWHAVSATEGFWDIGYPGVLRECEACHLPGTYDFSATASAAALPNRLFRTVATGAAAASVSLSPYVTAGTSYGSGFSFNTNTGVTTQAAGTTLVNSPTAAACFSCHDSTLARTHMEINGGSIYLARSAALAAPPETCMVCHASGRIADIKVMHAK